MSFFSQAVNIIGEAPVGDPNDLRAYAGKLRKRADENHGKIVDAHSAISSAGLIAGPLAERMKGKFAHNEQTLNAQLVERPRQLATYLEHAATELQHDQTAWKRAIEKKVNELENAARAAAEAAKRRADQAKDAIGDGIDKVF